MLACHVKATKLPVLPLKAFPITGRGSQKPQRFPQRLGIVCCFTASIGTGRRLARAAEMEGSISLKNLVSQCVDLAQRAGAHIRVVSDKESEIEGSLGTHDKGLGTGNFDPQTIADRQAQRCIVENLRAVYGMDLRIVGEEGELGKHCLLIQVFAHCYTSHLFVDVHLFEHLAYDFFSYINQAKYSVQSGNNSIAFGVRFFFKVPMTLVCKGRFFTSLPCTVRCGGR